ncbi:hypothetical protein K438DRAFT_1777503 [Mycena galopus ATCC 62051]|nr:hypothetical protein K438DRAFT_1777503 [Mycena galopus ATCC 62051]
MNTSFIREFAFSVAPAPASPPPILDPVALDALALCVSGLSFKKSGSMSTSTRTWSERQKDQDRAASSPSARSDLSPHAPGASGVNVAAVAPATSTSSPVVATFSPSNVAAPTSGSARPSKPSTLCRGLDVGTAALGDITNAGADTRRRSKRARGRTTSAVGRREGSQENATGRAKSTAGVKSILPRHQGRVDEYEVHSSRQRRKVDMGGGGVRSDSVLDAGTDSIFAAGGRIAPTPAPSHGRPKDKKHCASTATACPDLEIYIEMRKRLDRDAPLAYRGRARLSWAWEKSLLACCVGGYWTTTYLLDLDFLFSFLAPLRREHSSFGLLRGDPGTNYYSIASIYALDRLFARYGFLHSLCMLPSAANIRFFGYSEAISAQTTTSLDRKKDIDET